MKVEDQKKLAVDAFRAQVEINVKEGTLSQAQADLAVDKFEDAYLRGRGEYSGANPMMIELYEPIWS